MVGWGLGTKEESSAGCPHWGCRAYPCVHHCRRKAAIITTTASASATSTLVGRKLINPVARSRNLCLVSAGVIAHMQCKHTALDASSPNGPCSVAPGRGDDDDDAACLLASFPPRGLRKCRVCLRWADMTYISYLVPQIDRQPRAGFQPVFEFSNAKKRGEATVREETYS